METLKRYDEDLNDMTKSIISYLRNKERNTSILLYFVIVLCVMLCIGVAVIGNENMMLRKEIRECDVLIDKKNMEPVSLEWLVGYTMLHPQDSISDFDVWTIANTLGAPYPETIARQAALESRGSSWKTRSNIAKQANNLFGMKRVYQRDHLQVGTYNDTWGMYLCWEHSVIDRILWERSVFGDTIPSADDYCEYLQRVYSGGDERYVEKLRHVKLNWIDE